MGVLCLALCICCRGRLCNAVALQSVHVSAHRFACHTGSSVGQAGAGLLRLDEVFDRMHVTLACAQRPRCLLV